MNFKQMELIIVDYNLNLKNHIRFKGQSSPQKLKENCHIKRVDITRNLKKIVTSKGNDINRNLKELNKKTEICTSSKRTIFLLLPILRQSCSEQVQPNSNIS